IPLPNFRYKALESPQVAPPIGQEYDDSTWEEIKPHSYWGGWRQDFILRTTFQVANADKNAPYALYLPLGDAEDFSHPETLAYIDGQPYAAADRHHRELALNKSYLDGQPHRLALHGWTGGSIQGDPNEKLYMRDCSVVQIDTPTRQFVAAARVALEVADQL